MQGQGWLQESMHCGFDAKKREDNSETTVKTSLHFLPQGEAYVSNPLTLSKGLFFVLQWIHNVFVCSLIF